MDNITHAALGLAIVGAKYPNAGAAGVTLALLASELPDIDVFFGMGNPWSMITIHRGITHSIFVAPVAAAALAWIWSRFAAGGFAMFISLSLICLLGHIGLDVLTTFGTQMLEPFSHRRFGLGWVAIIDPVVTLSLLIGGAAAWWLRGRSPTLSWQVALGGLVLTAAYLGLGGLQHSRAMRTLSRQTASLGPAIACDATPRFGTIFVWRLLYRNHDTFWLARYNSLTGSLQGQKALRASIDPSLMPLLDEPLSRVFAHFAGQLIRPHVDPADPDTLMVEDMRFSLPPDAPSGYWALRIPFARDERGPVVIRDARIVRQRISENDAHSSLQPPAAVSAVTESRH